MDFNNLFTLESKHLFVRPEHSQTGRTKLARQYTLRACNRDYKRETGQSDDPFSLEELDCNKVPGKIATLRTFDNDHGHWSDGTTRIFPPKHFYEPVEFVTMFNYYINKTYTEARLWDIDGTILISYARISGQQNRYPSQFIYVSKQQQVKPYSPVSVYTAQAFVESSEKRGKNKGLYQMPSQSTVVTGILGGLSNNTTLEMGFDEDEGVKDAEKRTYDTDLIGFVCAGHTSHSGDAGKSRRIVSYSRVRVLSQFMLQCISEIKANAELDSNWIVYCMGLTLSTTVDGICHITYSLDELSRNYFDNQFGDKGDQNLTCPATYMIYEQEKILYISVSSGVVVRSMPGGEMIDSHMLNLQAVNSIIEHSVLPSNGQDEIDYKYCPFFMSIPYGVHDRPPRTLFASGQSTQGIFFPWSPATARVSPCHASKPMVATQFIRDIEKDFEENEDAIWDIFPGEDMTVCYMNMPQNYDDSMIVSSGFADRGGFSTLSVCTYRISESENIPIEGERMCCKKYKWWKVDCDNICVCVQEDKPIANHPRVVSTSARIPSGIVQKVIRTEDGHISIKIISFSQLLTGDKISTLHGQKGVVKIVPSHELPVIVTRTGCQFIADLYIAVGSIVSRQTNGQIYESSDGLRSARNGKLRTTSSTIDQFSEESKYILFPDTGKVILKELSSSKLEPIKATIGITRVLNQTQMTRERHHLTHRSEGKYSTGTRPGRADGGGVAAAEMDFHAMYSSGLRGCAQELLDRGNKMIVPVCKLCNAIEPLHDCGVHGQTALTLIPYDSVIFDEISAVVNGSCNRYQIEHT